MNNNIVFYIRALFHESIMPGNEKTGRVDLRQLVARFNSFSRITAQEYRKRVHEIQLKNISKISDQVIINEAEEDLNKKYNYTFCVLQKNTIVKLSKLKDDQIVIMLDDDDWISPEVANLHFDAQSLNYWNTASFTQEFPQKVFFHKKSKDLPWVLENEEHEQEAASLLSNCQAIPAYLIKEIIKIGRLDLLQPLLQRHTLARKIVRDKCFDNLNLREKGFDQTLSIYVRHAANITLLEKNKSIEGFSREAYEAVVKPYKSINKISSENIPAELLWSLPYLNQLYELNQQL